MNLVGTASAIRFHPMRFPFLVGDTLTPTTYTDEKLHITGDKNLPGGGSRQRICADMGGSDRGAQ